MSLRSRPAVDSSGKQPDLNPIEHDFAAIKKHREYQEHATIDDIVKAYH